MNAQEKIEINFSSDIEEPSKREHAYFEIEEESFVPEEVSPM